MTAAPTPPPGADPIAALADRPITRTDKGFGVAAARRPVTAATLAAARPAAVGGDLTMPLAVLRDSALTHNVTAMADWCAQAGVRLAPHGKTTMAPQLLGRQLAAGAWGITAATIGQAQVYRAFGIDRILIANELTDPAGIAWLAGEMTAHPGLDCYVYVDSVPGVRLLAAALAAAGATRPLPVLVELGFPGGRTGCRDTGQALAVAAAADRSGELALAGVAGYEGGIGNGSDQATLEAVADYCRRLAGLGHRLAAAFPASPAGSRPIISAGGSAYFDVVARELTAAWPPTGSVPVVVLRSGCYVIHDHREYLDNGPDARGSGPGLIPAMEVWAAVLSRPEPGLALAGAGRRDLSFDKGMPVPLRVRRADGGESPAGAMTVTRLDDQHAYLSIPAGSDLAPGDLVCLGISHPCTTFDKWRVIPVVDDDYRVIDAVHTFF
ncbi:MAG: alanine racemase [Streptosporangiaceae bacterium]